MIDHNWSTTNNLFWNRLQDDQSEGGYLKPLDWKAKSLLCRFHRGPWPCLLAHLPNLLCGILYFTPLCSMPDDASGYFYAGGERPGRASNALTVLPPCQNRGRGMSCTRHVSRGEGCMQPYGSAGDSCNVAWHHAPFNRALISFPHHIL